MEELSFRDILWHLVYARKLQNQLDIARYVCYGCFELFAIASPAFSVWLNVVLRMVAISPWLQPAFR